MDLMVAKKFRSGGVNGIHRQKYVRHHCHLLIGPKPRIKIEEDLSVEKVLGLEPVCENISLNCKKKTTKKCYLKECASIF